MSWLEKLYQTYDNCAEHIGSAQDKIRLLPICHTTQNAQIEIVIDGTGAFKRAYVIPKSEAATDIPCTEESGGRTGSKPICHPLCDKLQYLAGDYIKFGGDVTSGFSKTPEEPHKIYVDILSKWCSSQYQHPKINAIYAYVQKGSIIADLCNERILYLNGSTGQLLKEWKGLSDERPKIFSVMSDKVPPEGAFVRWVVENPGESQTKLWEDKSVWESWVSYYISTKNSLGMCYVTGDDLQLANQHPARLRHAADKAKLISANDSSGFTFRGRFTDSSGVQACGVGFEVSQKAHNVLRWLIGRQGYRNGSQAIVAWSISGKSIPDPFANSLSLLSDEECAECNLDKSVISISCTNVAQDFALRLKRKISGYAAVLGDTTDIVILALDSATPGRMSIIYYRELISSEFLQRLEAWHEQCSWFQNYGEDKHFIGAPAPIDIAKTAYGTRVDEKLLNVTIRQLLPCIIDLVPVPRQLVECCVRRACNKNGIEYWEWEKSLGIACALYRKHTINDRNYQMYLETNRTSRDYLYGRLLAIAERLEEVALNLSGEKRATNACRLMQRFADNPYSTWLTIEKALNPYEIRLRTKRGAFLHNIKNEMDAVMTAFKPEDYMSPAKLSGEFLLGYHCQRASLKSKTSQTEDQDPVEETNE